MRLTSICSLRAAVNGGPSQLLAEVARLAGCERQATADLVASLGEMDSRRLYLAEGCSSLFTYCTERLHLSEHAAYRRIDAARLARRLPVVIECLREGRLTLTAIGLLSPHLTEANHVALLHEAQHQPKRVVEELVARLHPRADVRSSVRRLPTPRIDSGPRGECAELVLTPAAEGAASGPRRSCGAEARGGGPAEPLTVCVRTDDRVPGLARPRAAVISPLSPGRYALHVTLSAETQAKLRRAQDLLRHRIPNGDPALVIDQALTALLAHLERTKYAATRARDRPGAAVARRGCTSRATTRSERSAGPPHGNVPACPASETGDNGRSDIGRDAAPLSRAAHARGSRYIPATVRRAVWSRDGGQCTFVGQAGRCTERGFLEFHHRVPFADGGAASVENLCLTCRQHNRYEDLKREGVLQEEQPPYQLGLERPPSSPAFLHALQLETMTGRLRDGHHFG